MRRRGATQAPIFTMPNSEYGDFLYAPIGMEENGMVVTALSAFARIGLDPWQEAARLAQMPKDAASLQLTSMIAGLPNGRWSKSDAGSITAGLMARLPTPSFRRAPSRPKALRDRPLWFWVAVCAFVIVLAGAAFFALGTHDPAPVIDDHDGPASTTNAPPAPMQ